MRRNLTHCGKKIPTLAVYSVRDFEPFSQLFLFAGGPCPQCGKIPIGHAGYDLWGQPLAFLANGTPIPSEEKGISPRLAMAGKKATQRYLRLIETGAAQKLDALPTNTRPQRGGPAGVSEFSLRAAKAHQRAYVLKLSHPGPQARAIPEAPGKQARQSRSTTRPIRPDTPLTTATE